MAKRLLTDDEIRQLIASVTKIRLGVLVKAVNILRFQKHTLPAIELELLETIENEIKRRNAR